MAGFRNETIFGLNVDFTGNAVPSPQITTDGQLLIGSTATPNIKVGTLTSTDSSVNINYSSPNIDLSAVGIDQQQIYYVGKHGNNTNSGLNINEAVLTFTQALTLATAATPSAINRFAIVCFDDGIYTEDLIGIPFVDIYAPNATIVATSTGLTVADNANYTFQAMQVPSGAFGVLKGTTDTATSWVNISEVTCAGTGVGFANISSAGGVLLCEWKTLTVEDGVGVGDVTSSGHMHVKGGDIYITGITGFAIALGRALAGSIVGHVDHILCEGAGVGIALFMAQGTIDVSVNNITTVSVGSFAINIDGTAGACKLNLFCNDLNGPQSVTNGAIANIWTTPTYPANQAGMINGQVVIGSTGANPVVASLSQGNNITVTPAAGAITIACNLLGTTQSAGNSLTALGSGALTGDTSGAFNTAVGLNALNANAGGGNNTAVGFDALATNVSGNLNTAVGSSALSTSITSANTAVGYSCLAGAAGANNSALGYEALLVSTAANNTAVGYQALKADTTGTPNTAVGYNALTAVTNGANNTALGYSAGSSYTGAESNNICIGSSVTGTAAENTTTRIGVQGTQTACFIAGVSGVATSNTNMVTIDTVTGHMGSAAVPTGGIVTLNGNSGSATGATVTITTGGPGAEGTSLFTGSGSTLTQTFSNSSIVATCIGHLSGSSLNGSSNANEFYGYQTGMNITAGQSNCIFGTNAARTGTMSYCCAFGAYTLQFLSGGTRNVAIGYAAGNAYTSTESSNIIIGDEVQGTAGESHIIRIGANGNGNGQQNQCFIGGIDGITVTGAAVLCSTAGQLGDVVSAQRFKENIVDIGDTSSPIMRLRPRSFNYISDETQTKCYGMIAEEVEEIFPDLVLYKDELPYSLKYHEMPALLLNEMQKMAKRIEELESKLNAMTA